MLGRVVSPLVNVIDVDGIVQRIDVNDLVDRIDWNKVLESVDFDCLLEKVDINKILQRVDLKDLVERAEIPAIVARSTSGIFSPLVDAFRSQLVMVDQAVQCSGCVFREHRVPPAPSARPSDKAPRFPKGGGNIAVAVQERYAGTFSRALAFLLDQAIITSLFFLVLLIIEEALEIILSDAVTLDRESSWYTLVVFSAWQFVYYASALAATSKTPGKAILGLKVVNNEDGTPVSTWRAVVRSLLLHISVYSIIGVLFGLVRKDRRELHDLAAGTGVVYCWDAAMARYRQQKEEVSQLLVTTSIIEEPDVSQGGREEKSTVYRRHFAWTRKNNSSRARSRQASHVMHL